MYHTQTVESLDIPELEPYLTLRHTEEHRRRGIFVAEGEKVVRRLLETDYTIISMLLTPAWLPVLEQSLQERPESIQVFLAEKRKMEQLTGFPFYQGVLAVAKIPPLPSLTEVMARHSRPYFFVAIDSVLNAQNLGLVVRNCAGLGAQALLVGETSGRPFLRRAVRNSMGSIFSLPVVELTDLVHSLSVLRAHGVRSLAAHPSPAGSRLSQADLSQDCCLVFGSEGYGISSSVLEACDEAVAIPMHRGVDSLNVGNATAAFLYEVNRQRGNG